MKRYMVVIVTMILLLGSGCSDSDDTSTKRADAYLKLSELMPSAEVRAGSTLSVSVALDASSVLEEVPINFFAVKSDDENNSIYLDANTLESVQVGVKTYTLDVNVPRDLVVGEYTILATVDPDDLLGEWDDEAQFGESDNMVSILEHGPDELIVVEAEDEDDGEETLSAATALDGVKSIVIEATDEDVAIEAILDLTPNLRELNATDINITVCLNIGSECIALPLWSSDGNGTLSDTLVLHDVENATSTLISVDTIMPYSDIAKIVTAVTNSLLSFQGSVLDSNLEITFNYNGLTQRYIIDRTVALSPDLLSTLGFSLAPQRTAALSPQKATCRPKRIDYYKDFSKSKYGSRFGAGAYANASALLDSEGIHSRVYGSVRVKALGRRNRFMKVNFTAEALPSSFAGTGYDLDVEVLDIAVYSKSNSLADVSGMSTPTITDVEEQAIKAKVADSNGTLTESQLRRQKLYSKAKKQVSTYSGSGSTAVGYVKTWDIGKEKSYTQQYIVGIVPVTIESGARSTIGFQADVALTGITEVIGSFKPKASIGAFVQGGVGVIGYSAGVSADLWLVTETIKGAVTASVDMVEDADGEYIEALEGNLKEKITNYYRGPNGKLYLYAEYTVPKYCKKWGVRYPCGVKSVKKKKYLGNFSTSSSQRTLLDKSQTLFTIALDDCN